MEDCRVTLVLYEMHDFVWASAICHTMVEACIKQYLNYRRIDALTGKHHLSGIDPYSSILSVVSIITVSQFFEGGGVAFGYFR